MRSIVVVTFGFAVLYAAFWTFGRQDRLADIAALKDRLAAAGVSVSYDRLATRGFPSRFDTRAEGLELTLPGGPAWRLPEIEAAALSYRPADLIVTFPVRQEIVTADGPVPVTSARLRAQVALTGDGWPARITVEGEGLAAEGLFAAGRLLVAARRDGAGGIDLYVEAADALLTAGAAPVTVDSLRADLRLLPVGPAGPDGRRPVDLVIRSAEAVIGGARLTLSGSTAEGIAAAPAWPAPVAALLPLSNAPAPETGRLPPAALSLPWPEGL